MLNKLFAWFRRRYKLWKICRAIGIKPYPWQRAFALGKASSNEFPQGRCTGKTMAVMLRLLVSTYEEAADLQWVGTVLAADPDWSPHFYSRARWYCDEHRRLWWRCYDAGIICPFLGKQDFHNIAF